MKETREKTNSLPLVAIRLQSKHMYELLYSGYSTDETNVKYLLELKYFPLVLLYPSKDKIKDEQKRIYLFFERKVGGELKSMYWDNIEGKPDFNAVKNALNKSIPINIEYIDKLHSAITKQIESDMIEINKENNEAKLGEAKTNPLKAMPTSDLAKHVATIDDSQEAIRVVQAYFNQTDGGIAGDYFTQYDDVALQAHWELLKSEDRAKFMKGYIQEEFDNLDQNKYIVEELNKNFVEHKPSRSADWGGIRHWKVDDNDGITGMFIIIDDNGNVILMSRSLTTDEDDYVDEDIRQVDYRDDELVMKLEELINEAKNMAEKMVVKTKAQATNVSPAVVSQEAIYNHIHEMYNDDNNEIKDRYAFSQRMYMSESLQDEFKLTKEQADEYLESWGKAQVPEDEEIANKWIVEAVQFRSVKVGDYLADGPNAREISKLIGINGNKSKLQRVWSSDESVPVGEIFYLDGYLASDDEENIFNRVTNFEDFGNSKTGKVQQSSALTPDEIVYLKLVMSGRNSSIEISIMNKLEEMYNQAVR